MHLLRYFLLKLLPLTLCFTIPHDAPQITFQSPIDVQETGEFLKFTVQEWQQSPRAFEHITGPFDLNSHRLLQLFNETPNSPRWMTELDKYLLRLDGVGFMDVTSHPELGQANLLRKQLLETPGIRGDLPLPTHVSNVDFIERIYDQLNATHLKEDIKKLSSFWTRNYRSAWGLASSNWIHDSVKKILGLHPHPESVTLSLRKFKHSFIQNSVIARLESANSKSSKDKPLIILGAHQDSLNYRYPFYRAPGADDDGSGSVTILQVLRSLITEGFIPPDDVAVEFHWYAAEEAGLLGSRDIAAQYEKDGKEVKGMCQMDMTAYVKPDTEPIIAFWDQKTSKNLTDFTSSLVDMYLTPKSGIGYNYTNCGPVCGSDHMSWNSAGYESIFVSEARFEDMSPHVHTTQDSLEAHGDAYSFEHMLEFVKLGIAYIVELSTA